MSSPFSHSFKKAEKLLWHDKIMARTVLRLFPVWIFPNYVTIFRFLTTPLVFVLLLQKMYITGLVFFLILAFTDAIDGSLARNRNQITDWGISYDPIADKILIGGMVLMLVTGRLGYILSFAIIAMEIVIVLRAWLRRRRGKNIQANIWGKMKMCLHVLGATMLILDIIFHVNSNLVYISAILWVAVFFAAISLFTGRL